MGAGPTSQEAAFQVEWEQARETGRETGLQTWGWGTAQAEEALWRACVVSACLPEPPAGTRGAGKCVLNEQKALHRLAGGNGSQRAQSGRLLWIWCWCRSDVPSGGRIPLSLMEKYK